MTRLRPWLSWMEQIAGTLLLLVGVLMITGHFTTMNALLANMGQLINLETP